MKRSIPQSMDAHKEFTDGRLKEISNEVKSLKSLISQRMNAPTQAPTPTLAPSLPTKSSSTYNTSPSNSSRPINGNAVSPSPVTTPAPDATENAKVNGTSSPQDEQKTATPTPASSKQDYISSLGGRANPFANGVPKASIPSWQMAAQTPKPTSEQGASSSTQAEGSP
jgi:peroxin-14